MRKVMVKDPWNGGQISLFSYLCKLEDREREPVPLPQDKLNRKRTLINHIDCSGGKYQLLFLMGDGYSDQSLYYKKQDGGNKYIPIAENIRIPEEDILLLASIFSKKGLPAVRQALGI